MHFTTLYNQGEHNVMCFLLIIACFVNTIIKQY